jgi:hypothetical protein
MLRETRGRGTKNEEREADAEVLRSDLSPPVTPGPFWKKPFRRMGNRWLALRNPVV